MIIATLLLTVLNTIATSLIATLSLTVLLADRTRVNSAVPGFVLSRIISTALTILTPAASELVTLIVARSGIVKLFRLIFVLPCNSELLFKFYSLPWLKFAKRRISV